MRELLLRELNALIKQLDDDQLRTLLILLYNMK